MPHFLIFIWLFITNESQLVLTKPLHQPTNAERICIILSVNTWWCLFSSRWLFWSSRKIFFFLYIILLIVLASIKFIFYCFDFNILNFNLLVFYLFLVFAFIFTTFWLLDSPSLKNPGWYIYFDIFRQRKLVWYQDNSSCWQARWMIRSKDFDVNYSSRIAWCNKITWKLLTKWSSN